MNEYNDKGLKEGPWKETFRYEEVVRKANYLNGKLHGLYESHNFNGNLLYKGNYINNKANGEHIDYYRSTGTILNRMNYKDGKLNGIYEYYDYVDKLKIRTYIL